MTAVLDTSRYVRSNSQQVIARARALRLHSAAFRERLMTERATRLHAAQAYDGRAVTVESRTQQVTADGRARQPL